ncbi:MAG: U32 family peptidase C-terminal domain-containing protein, partial [Clostridia bacterium]|nr:U32 family peptidase C-terminal domain-containing protein [Clostridia bacterium]
TFTQNMELAGRVTGFSDGRAAVQVKNKLIEGDALELMTPEGVFPFVLADMRLENGDPASICARPNAIVTMPVPQACEEGDLIRGTCRNHKAGE